MAAAPEDEDNELNFSDIDSDDEKPPPVTNSVIAHKDMKAFQEQQSNSSNESDDFEPISPPNREDITDQTFEPISPISDTGDSNKAGSSANEGLLQQNDFENISDDENVGKEDEDVAEGKFSPNESDNELNFDDENSNDSGYQLVTKSIEKQKSPENNDVDDVEAPIPSPFSDIGDLDDLRGTDSAIINDILENKIDKNFDVSSLPTVDHKDDLPLEKDEVVTKPVENTLMETVDESTKEKEEEMPSEKATIPVEESTGSENKGEKSVEDDEDDAGDLIADIFGESDEEEEFEGFADEDLLPEKNKVNESVEDEVEKPVKDEESSDEETIQVRDFVSDFDIMLQKKKELNRIHRRSKKDFEIINDNDDIIASMIQKMKEAAENDRMLNQNAKAATNKLSMLPSVINHLKKANLQHMFIDGGVLPAIKEWLSPLPDHALPHVNIRKTLLKILNEFPPLNKNALKSSGIGRAVMLLFKHPKEIPENKKMASRIISVWARPIFNVSANFQEMSREDRMERDKASMLGAKRRRLSSDDNGKNLEDDESRPRKPGDKGWIGRARVPMPSHRDYLNRPVSKIDTYDTTKSVKKELSRFEKHARKYRDKRTSLHGSRKAVSVSLNGGKMAL